MPQPERDDNILRRAFHSKRVHVAPWAALLESAAPACEHGAGGGEGNVSTAAWRRA